MATDLPPDAPRTPPPTPAPRLRTLRGTAWRWTLLSLLALLVLLGLAVAGAAWLLRTPAGNAWVLGRVPGLVVQQPQGVFSGGPYATPRLSYTGADGLQVTIENLRWQDLRWRFRPSEGTLLGLVLQAPQADRVVVRTAPTPEPPPAQPPLQRPGSLRLPLELQVQNLAVGSVLVDDQPAITDVAASLHLGADRNRSHLLQGLRLTRDGLQLTADGRIGTQDDMAVQLQAALRSAPDSSFPVEADVQANGPLDRIGLTAALRATGTDGTAQATPGKVDLQATVTPFAAWPLGTLTARLQALDLAPLANGLPTTRLDGDVRVDSAGAHQPAEITLQLTNGLPGRWDELRLPLQGLQLTLQGTPSDRSTLSFTRLQADLPAAGRVEGSGRWQADALQLDLQLAGVQPAQLDARAAAMTVSGPLALSVRGLPSPDGSPAPAGAPLVAALRGTLDGRLAQPQAPRARVVVDAEVTRQPDGQLLAEVKQLQASAGAARAQAKARFEMAPAGAWSLDTSGSFTAFDPTPWIPGPAGSAWRKGPHKLDGNWKATANLPSTAAAHTPLLQAVRGTADLALRNSLLAGVPLDGTLNWKATGVQQLSARLNAAGNRLELEGQTGGAPAADRWQGRLDAPALAALAPLGGLSPALQAWMPKAGTAEGRFQLQGRWPALQTDGNLQVNGLVTGDARLQRLVASWQASADANAPLSLDLQAQGLAQGVQRLDNLKAVIDGSLARHRFSLEADSPVRPPAWADVAEARRTPRGAAGTAGTALLLRGDGTWQPASRLWQGRVSELSARDRVQPQPAWLAAQNLAGALRLDADGGVAEASLQPGRLEALGAALRWQAARWQAASGGTPQRIDVEATLDPLRVAPWLARFQPDMRWGGDLALQGRISLHSAGTVAGDVVIERAGGDLTLADDAGMESLGLTDLRVAASAQNGTWYFTQAVAGANLGVLAGSQALRPPAGATWPTAQTPLEGVLEWRVDNLAVWAPWVPPAWRLGGKLRTSAYFSGTLAEPGINGELVGSELAVRNLLQGIDARNGSLSIQLRGTEATLQQLRLQGGDGTLSATGRATLGAKPTVQLKVLADRFTALGRLDRRIVTSGSADVGFEGDRLKVDGRFGIDEGLIDFSRGDAPSLDGDVVVVRRRGDAPITPDEAAAAKRAAAPTPAPAMNADVRVEVSMGEQLKLKGRGIDTRLKGRVTVTTPGGQLAVNGAVRTESGTYAAYGQKLEIERGIVRFDGPVENPRLEIVAIRPNLDVAVGVQIGGTALNPRVRLFSDPDMADMDKLSWLLLGRAPDGLARTDTALLQRAAMALIAGDGPSRTGDLMKSIGLDDLSVRQEETGTTKDTIVSLGKQISQRVYLGYEHGVNSAAGNWQLIYRAAQRFTLRAQAGADTAIDVIWTWRWN